MQTAKDIMTENPVTVTPETELAEAAKLMVEHHFNGLPVIDGSGALVGVICQSDLITTQKQVRLPSVFSILGGYVPLADFSQMEAEMKKISAVTVGDAMTKDVVTVSPDTDLEDIATLMVDKKLHTLPVTDGGSVVGVIGKEDVLKTLIAK